MYSLVKISLSLMNVSCIIFILTASSVTNCQCLLIYPTIARGACKFVLNPHLERGLFENIFWLELMLAVCRTSYI